MSESIKDFFTKREKVEDKKKADARAKHKCNNCVYADWQTDEIIFCPFTNCIREDKSFRA